MYHYLLTYDLRNSKKFNGSYRDQIITFLLKNKAYDLSSYVATTIYFRSDQELPFWINELKSLNNDITNHLVMIATNSSNAPKMNTYYNINFSIAFDGDVERIQASI